MNFNEFKERVRAANDITDVIGRYVTLKKSGSYYKGLCPFHNEKTPSFYVIPDNQYYHCFGCNKSGDVFGFLCDYNNLDFMEALEELARNAGIDIPDSFDRLSGDERNNRALKSRLLEMYKDAAEFYYERLHSESGKEAYEYLKKRGVSPNMMTAFGLGYAPGANDPLYDNLKKKDYSDEEMKESGLFSYKSGRPKDYFFKRIMFPIMNKASRVIAFGGRVLGDGNPKYLNSPETAIFSKKNNLYGIHRAVRTKNNRIILVEGYMDVIALHQAGFSEAVASLGTALTQEQASLIFNIANKVYLVYDTDSAGTQAKLRAIPILRASGLFVNTADMLPYKDPDELIKSEGNEGFEKRIDKSENAFFFELKELSKKYNLDDPSERADFEAKTAERITDFDNKFERESYIEAVACKYNIDRELLRNEVSRIGNLKDEGVGLKYRVRLNKGVTGENRNVEKTDEKNVLCALISTPEYYENISRYVSPDDFSPGLMRELAIKAFEGTKRGGITVAEIMDQFPDEEADDIGRIFSNENYNSFNKEENMRFVSDAVISLLKRRIDERIMLCTGNMEKEYRELSLRQKEAESLKSIFDK